MFDDLFRKLPKPLRMVLSGVSLLVALGVWAWWNGWLEDPSRAADSFQKTRQSVGSAIEEKSAQVDLDVSKLKTSIEAVGWDAGSVDFDSTSTGRKWTFDIDSHSIGSRHDTAEVTVYERQSRDELEQLAQAAPDSAQVLMVDQKVAILTPNSDGDKVETRKLAGLISGKLGFERFERTRQQK